MITNLPGSPTLNRPWNLLFVGAIAVTLAFIYWDGLVPMANSWRSPQYSHGALIPLISLALIWQRWPMLSTTPLRPSWWGAAALLLAMLLFLIGELSTIYLVIQYSMILALGALVISAAGWQIMRVIWIPLVYLLFMIPLPDFFEVRISLNLQLISSEIGVALIRLFGISVFLEGNVIDLGTYQLQVAEACSGLRYLFPLMSFSFLIGYLYTGPLWQRWTIFLSSIPITVLMNSFRIGVIGILVNRFGTSAAEGFLHFFEGWAIFILCLIILWCEVWVFTRFSRSTATVWERLDLSFPALPGIKGLHLSVPKALPLAAAFTIMLGVAIASPLIEARDDQPPDARALANFPLSLGSWLGREQAIEQQYIDALQFDDYLMANYDNSADTSGLVNLYVAYYQSQRKGVSIHSPRSCIPGDGWEIASFSQRQLDGVRMNGQTLAVNRALIQKGVSRQLVYYWFEQRGRSLTNEYLLKWYILWDGLTRRRTDGALVRLTIPVADGMDLEDADRRLTEFLEAAEPHLAAYVPI